MSEELEHSEFGPSGAAAWSRCPGKIAMERGRPQKVRREAAEGTVFHDYAAMALELGFEPHQFPLGEITKVDGYEIAYDQEMVESMYDGLAWIEERVEPGDMLIIERKVDISRWCGQGQFGTLDVGIVKPARRKIIDFDWKYGKGVPVSPVENEQCFLYCGGMWETFDLASVFDCEPAGIEVEFCIEQPRAPGGGGYWTTDMGTVLAHCERLGEAAAVARRPGAPRIPGTKQCMFCNASGDCPEQAKWLLETYGQKLDDLMDDASLGLGVEPTFPDPAKLDLEVRSHMLLVWPAFKRFVDRIHALTLHDLKSGVEVPMLKAVEGRKGHRYYVEGYLPEAEQFLTRALGDKAIVKKLISPAEAQKALGKATYDKNLKPYVGQPPGKMQLVPKTDKRDAVQDFASKLDDIEENFTDDENNGEN